MENKVRWGILASGTIANQFADGLKAVPGAEIYAVGSRSLEKASEFARKYGLKKAYGSYEELAADTGVDIVYIATPHPFHYENTMMCLKAGKAVLCEKPFAMNAGEAAAMIGYARGKGIFLMEAMWTRYLPAIAKAREWIAEGRIGDIRFLKADFGFRGPWIPEGRILNPELGGGALLDVGIYPVSFASLIFGSQPKEIKSIAHIGSTGVDEQCALLFGYEEGRIASLNSAVRTDLNNEAVIFGTAGRIVIPEFWHASTAFLMTGDKPEEKFGPELAGNGYNYEAAEATSRLKRGDTESPDMTLDETLALMNTMDQIRSQWGLSYPSEKM